MAEKYYIPINEVFGLLTVVALDHKDKKNGYFVNALCVCGSTKIYRLHYLKNGHTQSCGCMRAKKNIERSTHGHASRGSLNRTYTIYRDMLTRCENPNYKQFNLYGGRGIKICQRWMDGYEFFLADMGERQTGMSIERKDVNGDYSPSNCIWANNETQANNKRNSVRIEYAGKVQTVAQWARELGILDKTIYFRLSKGYLPEQALMPIPKKINN